MASKSSTAPGWTHTVKSAFYVFWLCLALIVGSLAGWLNQSPLLRNAALQAAGLMNPPRPIDLFGKDSITVLLLGCDEDLYFGGKQVLRHQARSDMMLIAKLDFKTNRIWGVSIPRDTRCRLPGYRSMKINAYHAVAKRGREAELTQEAVEFLLPGVHIDKVLTIDYDAFQDLVNLVGGVQIQIPKRMFYNDNAGNVHVNFFPGPKLLNGYDAMMFVRYRHGDSDFERQKRQKDFLLAFKDSALKNKMMLPQIAEKGKAVLGKTLSDEQIASIIAFSRGVKAEHIVMGQVPVVQGRGSFLEIDKRALPRTLTQFGLVGRQFAFDHP